MRPPPGTSRGYSTQLSGWAVYCRLMDEADVQGRLVGWWSTLSAEGQEHLLRLSQGDELPARYVSASLTEALGAGPVGVSWEGGGGGFTFYVDERLGRFLARQRDGAES